MKQLRGIMFGMSLIIFGIACFLLGESYRYGIFELLGVICPVLGIVVSIIYWYHGLIMKD